MRKNLEKYMLYSGFQDQLSINAGQKYCRMLQGEHSAILSTFIKPPFVIKIFVLSIFERRFYTGFTDKVIMSYYVNPFIPYTGWVVTWFLLGYTVWKKWRTSFHTDVLSKSK